MMNNKKGNQSTKFVMALIVFALLIVLAAGIFVYVLSNINVKVTYEPASLHDDIIMKRFYTSSSCLAYEDLGNGRVYPGIIDIEKFNSEMFKCVDSLNRMSLELFYDGKVEKIEKIPLHGNLKSFDKRVLVYDGDLHNATLRINVVTY